MANQFLPIFLPVAKEIARLGAINSLTQTLLKLTLPGVPDIYQGNEIWDYSLVDPDNRRSVDYSLRREMLGALPSTTPDELTQTWPDGRMKLFLTQRVLRFRCGHADIFQQGEYPPIRELWKETIIEFPETLSLENAHDLFTCHPIPLRDRQANLADALSVLPFAAITNL